jgi:hypothetical protein
MHDGTAERTFEHDGHVIHVHAFRAITDAWTIQVTVVGNGRRDGAWAKHVAWNKELRGVNREDALDTGAELARAYVDGITRH